MGFFFSPFFFLFWTEEKKTFCERPRAVRVGVVHLFPVAGFGFLALFRSLFGFPFFPEGFFLYFFLLSRRFVAGSRRRRVSPTHTYASDPRRSVGTARSGPAPSSERFFLF